MAYTEVSTFTVVNRVKNMRLTKLKQARIQVCYEKNTSSIIKCEVEMRAFHLVENLSAAEHDFDSKNENICEQSGGMAVTTQPR